MLRNPHARLVMAALLAFGSPLMGLSGCEDVSTLASPQGDQPSSLDFVAVAEGLASGTLPQDKYDQLLLLPEEDRRIIRRHLLRHLTEEEIVTRSAVFAVVGPPDDVPVIPDHVVNAAIPWPVRESGGLSTEAWYLYVSVPFYSQNDTRWSGNGLGFNACGNSTIGRYGCHLCCVAMLYAKWGYSQMNPPGLNDWSQWGRAHYAFTAPDVRNGNCGDYIRLPQSLEYPGLCRPWRYTDANHIWPELAAGHPVIARTSQYNPAHFVVIFGHNGQRYYVKDPVKNAANQDQPLTSANQFRVYGY